MALPEANSTTVPDLYCLWVACPCLSWSTVATCALTWVVFIPRTSHWCCALAVVLHRRDSGLGISHARKTTFSIHEILHLFKIYSIWPQADIHTHTLTSANAVTLVWGSLRLAPIKTMITKIKQKIQHLSSNWISWIDACGKLVIPLCFLLIWAPVSRCTIKSLLLPMSFPQ